MKNFLLLLMLLPHLASAQLDASFWSIADSSPADDHEVLNLCLSVDPATDALYIGTTGGIFKSSNNAESWIALDLPTIAYYKIALDENKIYAVASDGVIYYSHDNGITWGSSALDGVEEIQDIVVLSDGSVIVATGHILVDDEVGLYRGNGIFKSTNFGISWDKLDLGQYNDRYIGHLARTSDNLILASVNEYNTQDGAILYSADKGLSWSNLPLPKYNDGSQILSQSSIVNVTSLEVDRADAIHLSFLGAVGQASTALSLNNSITGAFNGEEWSHMRVLSNGYPWMYPEIHNIFFAGNGDIYVARPGMSFILSGIFYSSDGDQFTRNALDPVIIDNTPYFPYCSFVQQQAGRVYVVQEFDSKVCYTDISPTPPLDVENPIANKGFQVYPNPARDVVHLKAPEKCDQFEVILVSSTGAYIQHNIFKDDSSVSIDVSLFEAGLYSLQVVIDGKRQTKQLVILK